MTNIIQILQEHRDGALLAEVNDKLAEVLTSVAEHGKAASFSFSLKFTPNGEDAVTVKADVSAKAAQPKAVGDAIFFIDEHGNLSRRSSRQGDLVDELERRRQQDAQRDQA